tara:strand:- start:4909 stop:5397 length:489 start_codon:yes stop_codon:yes gene_type:complete
MIKKRGLSPVVATVLLILLTIAAITLISSIIVPFVQTNLEESTECLAHVNYVEFDNTFSLNCYSGNRHGLSVKVLEEEVERVEFVFKKEGESKRVGLSDLTMYSDGSAAITPGKGEVRTYVYDAAIRYSKVEVYPVIEGEVCTRLDSIEYVICDVDEDLIHE